MPIMGGCEATTRIRSLESESKQQPVHRIPIFAVSASLYEDQRMEYVKNGFDGWLLKPLDFSRVMKLLLGTRDSNVRNSAVYVPGEWEHGGWFLDDSSSC
jgi:CheY-like chemotaxis protein